MLKKADLDCARPIGHCMMSVLVALFFHTATASIVEGERQLSIDLSKIPTPPAFVHEPNPTVMYFVIDSSMQDEERSSTINLKERRFMCKATGYPPAEYRWLKNGQPFNLSTIADRVTQVPSEGSFVLSRLLRDDEGVYQCIAENGNGSAVDREIVLHRTFMSYFPKSEPEIIDIQFGDPFQKNCEPPPSQPKARVFWIFKGADGRKFQTINSSSLAINDHGTLFIQYANMTDQLKGNMYFTCTAENTELKDYKFGNQFRLNILKDKRKSIEHIPPYEQYVSPRVTTALRGESFELFCIFAGYPDLLPEWRKVGGEIDQGRVNWGTNFRKSLRLDDVDFGDAGEYECLFAQAPELNRKLVVQVHSAPYWDPAPPVNQNSSEGETVEMECAASGQPAPTVRFFKNGRPLASDDRYTLDGRRLVIAALRKGENGTGDNGVYQCRAENRYGYVWANFYLNILSFPSTVIEDPGDQEAVVGQKATLRCRVFGSPKPTIDWINPPSSTSLRRYTSVDAYGDTRLILLSVDKRDEGGYQCRAFNKYGNDARNGTLIVRDPTRLFLYPTNETIVAGQQVRLPCKAYHDANLHVNYKWLIDGVQMDQMDNRRLRLDDNYTLIIDNPTAMDSADYTCVAETKLDKAERTATVLVKDVPMPPFFVSVTCSQRNAAVRFQHRDRPRSAAPVDSFWVHYNSDNGEPDAWHIYPSPVTTRADKDWWTINVPLHPYGNFSFRAVARNEVGDSAPTTAHGTCSTAAAVPEVNPTNVVVKGTAPDNLVIRWDPVPPVHWNGPDFHYLVEYRSGASQPPEEGDDDGDQWRTKIVADPHQSSLTIDDQPTYKPYDARVRSVNALGVAAVAPATVSGYSGEGYPEQAPQNFQLVSIDGPSVATFSWDPVDPATIHGNFKGYKVVHWSSSSSSGVARRSVVTKRKETLFDRSATHGKVYDLKPFGVNYAEVYASNDAYDSPPSATLRFEMPEGVPSAVDDLSAFALSHREVGVMWKMPKEINGVMVGYNLTHCALPGWSSATTSGNDYLTSGTCLHTFHVPEVNHERLTGLKAETTYRVELRALTKAGPGDPVSVDVRTLPEGINNVPPSEPSMVETGTGPDQINVTWIPGQYDPEKPTPVGDKFYFKYRVKGTDHWDVREPQGNNFSVSLNDLYPGTVYEVKAVSVVDTEHGGLETESPIYYVATDGGSGGSLAAWLIAVLVAILVLILLILIVVVLIRCRGAKYPVSAKEKEQGREPMLKDSKGFDEYYPDSVPEDKRSLTGVSKSESDADSMAQYDDGETGRFTEDGSFIGQYAAPNKTFVVANREGNNPNVSTFV